MRLSDFLHRRNRLSHAPLGTRINREQPKYQNTPPSSSMLHTCQLLELRTYKLSRKNVTIYPVSATPAFTFS